MTAISGTRRAMKEMADGTIRVQIDIDPSCRGDFLAMFGAIDMPVALAPLVAQFEKAKPVVAQEAANSDDKKGGELAKLAGIFCQQPDFWEFADASNAEEAREWILRICDIKSRRELDHNVEAAIIFHSRIRLPYLESRK